MAGSIFLNKILKIAGYLIITILILIVLLFGLFYLFEDEIKDDLLSIVNKNQAGEFEIKEIDLTLLKYFPLISLQLGDVLYHEKKLDTDTGHSSKIAKIKRLDVSLNVIDLIRGTINVEKLTIDEGEFTFIIYSDSTTNLMNAVAEMSSKEDTSKTDIILKNVTIYDLSVNFKNFLGNSDGILKINQLNNNIAILENVFDCQLDVDGRLEKLSINNDLNLENQRISAQLDFMMNLDSLFGDLTTGRIEIGDLILLARGKFGYPNDHLAKLEIELSDENIELVSQIFSDDLLRNKNMITQGSLYGNGMILWKSLDLFPIIDFNFGLMDLNIVFPHDTSISVFLDFDGHLYTGDNPDLSDMKFDMKDIKVQLPKGKARGTFSLHNWQNPTFNLEFDADLDMRGYENIFNIEDIDSLSGKIKLKTSLSGHYDNLSKNLIYQNEEARLDLENLSFYLPKVNPNKYKISIVLALVHNVSI